MAIDLKPCPFCGWKAKVSYRQYRFKEQYDDGTKRIKFAFYGICNRCKATGGTVTGEIHCGLVQSRDDFRFYEELAAKAWNTRYLTEYIVKLPEPPKEDDNG